MPFFRRLLLPPEQLPEELKRVQDGVLVRLPVAEFDALVERAERAVRRGPGPQLLEARYHAVLKEESLIGEGQWKLVHSGPGPALLNLQPFNLALRQSRFENGEALIAAFDGKTPALLVETPGERTVSLDWSARAESSPEGLQFHLEMPSCPVAVMELDVPAERGVSVLNDGALLSGPHEAERTELRRWKIVCGGRQRLDRQRVDVRIHPAERASAGAELPPIFLVRQKTTQKLYPDGLEATFELSLDSLPHGIREFVCECDAELRLREIIGPDVDGWAFQPGTREKPTRLTVRLREPMRAGTWQVLCVAPLQTESAAAKPITWRCPGLRLVNGVPRGETLMLWFHPDLRVENWDSGNFILSYSEIDRATGSQVLTLQGGNSIGPPRRPVARLQAYGVEFSTHQLAWWRCNASGMALTVQIGWEVSQGRLFQLPILLPTGWEVEKIEMAPAALLRDWYVRKAAGKATLFVDLTSALGQPLRGKSEVREPKFERGSGVSDSSRRLPVLTVHLRPTGPGAPTERRLPFPDVEPLGARFREGALALDCDEQLYHLQVRTSAERTEPEGEGPWGQQLPEYYYRYRGQSVTGEIHVRPRPPRLRAKCDSEVFVAGNEAILETHLQLEAESGSPNTVELWLSAGGGEAWQWRSEAPQGEETAVNRVRSNDRMVNDELSSALHLLAAAFPFPLETAVVQAARPAGERWRLTLVRPLRLGEPLRLSVRRRLQLRNNRWEVPLPLVLGAERMEGQVVLHLENAGLVSVQSFGLREISTNPGTGASPSRTFRYEEKNNISLSLAAEIRPASPSPKPGLSPVAGTIESASLITYVGQNDVLRHHFSFRAGGWGERTIPLRLPSGSTPLAVGIDGRWLPQLIPGFLVTSGHNDAAVELALPALVRIANGLTEDSHTFEVVYTRTMRPGTFWRSLDAPIPQLPIAPLTFRRSWRMSRKLAPVFQGLYRPLPGTADSAELPALPRHAAELFHLPPSLEQFDPLWEDQRADVREALRQTVQELSSRHADQKISLREIVSEASSQLSKVSVGAKRCPLIIDDWALGEAGVAAETRLRVKRLPATGEASILPEAQPWAECGLVAMPGRSAILLTTNSALPASLRTRLSEEVENALAEAAQYGQDISGRFRSALSWLRPESAAVSVGPRSRPLDFDYEGSEWSEWEPIAGVIEERMIVVRRDLVTALGMALGLLLFLLLGWVRFLRRRVTFLLSLLALFGLGVLWLPATLRDLAWWPLLAIGVIVAWEYVRAVVRRSRPQSTPHQPKSVVSAAAVAGMVALGMFGWTSRAAAPASFTVYLVPASADAPDRQTVLAPAELLDRLKALARPAALVPGGPQAVLLDASYEGRLEKEGKLAEFAAVFTAYSLDDEPVALIVPLSGVQLVSDVLVDGARAAPLAAPQLGYSLSVRGRGRHKIEMHFRVPVVGTAEDRNVLFTVPPLVRSRVFWRVPAGAVEPQVLVKNGAQWLTDDAEGQILVADLGAPPLPIQLHWYHPKRPTRVSYQAAYLWNLGLEVNRLSVYFHYHVEQGAVKTLEIDLPAELEVSSASAQRTVSISRPVWQTRFQLHAWYVTQAGPKRVLHLVLPYPISGDFQVTLELLPRGPLGARSALPLPAPLGIRAGGPHYLAYRTQPGLNAQRDTSQNLTRISSKEFAPNWLGGPSLEANFQGIAYRIPPDRPPQLFLRLEHKPPLIQGDIDVSVRVNTQRAEVEATADVAVPNKDLTAIEWELPPRYVLAALTGEDVRTWKQNGTHLLVWLNRTTAQTRIHLSGWIPLARRDGHPQLELNGPHLLFADKQHVHLRLAAAAGSVLTNLRTRNLQPVKSEVRNPESATRLKEDNLDLDTWNLSYSLECQVQAAANAAAHVLTVAEIIDRELHFTTTVDYIVRHGELRQVRLRLRNWEEERIDLEAEHLALRPAPRRGMGERSWVLLLQPGIRGHYRLTLRGSMPLDKAAGGIPMPEVSVQDVENAEYFVAVVGGELIGQAKGAFRAVKIESENPKSDLTGKAPDFRARIADLLKRGGQAWRVGDSDWQVRLLPQPRILQPPPMRIYLLEHWMAVVDGRRWLHEVRCWLYHGAQADLTLDFAAPVRILSVTVEDAGATPHVEAMKDESGRINKNRLASSSVLPPASFGSRSWLSLPGQAGVCYVRLRWLYDPPESLDRPNLGLPQFLGAIKGPTLETVIAPPGWQVSLAGATGWRGPSREALLDLWRADAQLHILQDLAKQKKDSSVSSALIAAQQSFDLYYRHAQHALDLDGGAAEAAGPQGQNLADWLAELQVKDRAIKSEIRNPKSEGPLPDLYIGYGRSEFEQLNGIPLTWQVQKGAGSLSLQLTSQSSQQIRRALVASILWLAVVGLAWIASVLPFLTMRLHLFWPEQIALLAAIGWRLTGLTTIVLGLFLVAACGRGLLLVRGLRSLVGKRKRQPSTMTASSGVAE